MTRFATFPLMVLLLLLIGCTGRHESIGIGTVETAPSLTAAVPAHSLAESTVPRISEEPVSLAARGNRVSQEQTDSASLGDIFFEFDSALLSPQAQAILQHYANRMRTQPTAGLRIEGMADPRGTQDYNYVLGERRAVAVKTYLIHLGLNPEQLVTVSYGSLRLVCHRKDEECYQLNRRAHLVDMPAPPMPREASR
ncbi:OmpA family protein [Nitrospira sp. Nam74]